MSTSQIETIPAMQAVLDQYAEMNPLPLETLAPEHARQLPPLSEAVRALIGSQTSKRTFIPVPEHVAKLEHRLLPGPKGDVLVRIYTPVGDGPFPVLLYLHGGGWVIATLDTYDSSCRSLANLAKAVVVSVAYRQAPEYKFPIAIEESFAAYKWLLENAAAINGDSARIAVSGESAGGNMAAVLCLLCRDRNVPMPLHQLLIYPVTDFSFDSPSYQANAEAKPLNRAMMKWFSRHYLNHPAEAAHPYVSPLRAEEFRGLPPATVITAEIDPLRSEGEAYARKLEAAGTPVWYRNYEGVTHEFFGMKAVLIEAREANDYAAIGLRAAFNQ